VDTCIETKLIENYDKVEDKVLVKLIHRGDEEALNFLINKYSSFICAKARSYFLKGADQEDLVQEGMIGLYKAIRDFREDKMASFKTFSEICINRQIFSAIKTANRQKQGPLNSYISLYKPLDNQDLNYTLIDMVPEGKTTNPEALIINQENADERALKIADVLSKLEKKVWDLYIEGYSYLEVSRELNLPGKSIDNALQRIKRKLERHLEIRQAI
jgi:RNA polymerase sporulation-specific sigma factor